uniref:Galactosyltransferase C-terminal domain-containing protein n=1 Tax=Globisporangium ultimum (strain ATCC 200006 / CBS 805.95 / DAOM BR144) TaxID=431595 RepID=K3X9X5_GLOUD
MDALFDKCAALQDGGGTAAQRKRKRDDGGGAMAATAQSEERERDAKRLNQGGELEESDAAREELSALEASASPDHSAQEAARSPLRVAIIVPFRDSHPAQKRQAHLDKFVPHMTALLTKQDELSAFHIFIMEQSLDGRKFNRGKLLNAGSDIARNDYDVFIFHDVDLLPGDDLGQYYAHNPVDGPFHIARVWDRYNSNPKYFGGIVAFSRRDFIKINGFPNNFWGWGGEDDELYCRVVKKKLTIHAPLSGTITDLEEMKLEDKLEALRATKWKCTVKRELLKEHVRTWKHNGIKSLRYTYVDAVALNDFCTKITVDLGSNDHWSDARSSLDADARSFEEAGEEEDTEQVNSASDQGIK